MEEFYEKLPFDYSSAESTAELIRSRDQITAHLDVWRILNSEQLLTVMDVGCGTGWFADTVALCHRFPVVGRCTTYEFGKALSCVAGLVAEGGFLHLGPLSQVRREPFLDPFK